MTFRTVSAAVVVCLGMAAGARADRPLPPGRAAFRSFGLEEGLTNLSPLCLAQDPRGILWVGTEDGLFWYDGQRFTRLGLNEGLPSETILQLAVAPDGAVWVGTEAGLSRVNEQGVTAVPSVPATRVASVSVAPDGCTWVCADQPQGGLYRSCGDRPFEPAPGWPGGACTAALATRDGSVLVTVREALETRTPEGLWQHTVGTGLGDERIDALLLDARGRLWLRSIAGLSMRPSPGQPFTRVDQGLPRAYLSGRITAGLDGAPWVPTVLGLAQWNDDGRWSLLDASRGVPSASMTVAFIDAEGSPWLGGLALHRWLGAGQWSSYTTREGLPSDVVWAIVRDPGGTLWVATDQGLCFATADGWKTVPFSKGLGIKAIAVAKDGSLWLGAAERQVLHFSPTTDALERYHAEAGLQGSQITAILIDAEGLVLVAAEEGGLLEAHPADRPITFRPVAIPGFRANETFRSIITDREGRLWSGGADGLVIRERNGQWRRLTTRDGLLQDYVGYLAPRDDGSVLLASWASVGYSIARYEGGVLRCEHDRSLDGRKIYSLLEEPGSHRRFMGTGSGLEIVDGPHRRHLTQSDGLPGDDFDANALALEPNGDVWLGTSSGLGLLHGEADRRPPTPPRTLIEAARLGVHPLRSGGPVTRVEHDENTLTVHFASVSFANEKKVNYASRVVGFDARWNESAVPEARFTNLPPGAFTFEVRSRIGDGPWGESATLGFSIRPAFWQTRWFPALIAALVVLLSALAVRWRRAAVRGATALSQSEVLLRSVFSVMGEGMVLHDEQGRVVLWNASTEQILGLTPAQLRGEAPRPADWEILREDGTVFPELEQPAALTRATGAAQRRVIMALRRGTATRWLSVSSEPLRSSPGGTFAAVTTLTDVTELRRGREELQSATRRATEASELKSQFVANMSHELRTPLNAVLVLSRLGVEEPSLDKVHEYLGIIQRSGEGLLGLVNDILDLSKIEAGKLGVERIPFLLHALVREIAQTLEPMIEARHLRFSVTWADGVPDAVMGDPLRVRQVLTNLLSNATKFTEKGFIELHVSHRDGQVAFVTRDSGIGITGAQQERLFAAFSQADSTTTRRFGGTGLGLAISRSLARAMGGDLTVSSVAGEGSTFTFTVPLPAASGADASALRPATRQLAPAELAGRRALLVEDNKVNQLVARMLLQKAGMQVTLAEDGRAGLEAVVAAPDAFDVVLMDVQMPVMDGYSATAAIRAQLGAAAPPVVAMTANAMVEQQGESLRAGMAAHVSKPIDVNELYAVLVRVMAARAQGAQGTVGAAK